MLFKNILKRIKRKELPEGFIEEILGNMVEIPAGSFLMGSHEGEDDERPIHNVLIDRFYLCKYVVTQGEWYTVMETKPWEGVKFVCEADRCPVVNISWYEAREFIEELNRLNKISEKKFRMPTEAEWEYACRAGASYAFSYGVLKINLPKYAWYYDNAFKKGIMHAHEVGTRRPNKFGLCDMQGNVYEWCADWYRRNYYNKSPIENPKGSLYSEYKSVRGGHWAHTEYFLRIACRRHYSPHHKDSYVSFRLAMDADQTDSTTVTNHTNNLEETNANG